MKLTQRILFLLKTAWNDLFGEEQQSQARQVISGDTTAGRLNGLLDEAQQHLDALRLELANAVTRQKRIRRTWQEALTQIESLNSAIDEALKAGREAEARTLLGQVNPLQKGTDEMAELVQVCEKHTSEIRAAVNSQQDQLDSLRRRSLLLEDRENSLVVLNELFGTQQSLTRQTDKMQNELAEWEEQIARREDQLAARREWSK
jgi:phage shock protein A